LVDALRSAGFDRKDMIISGLAGAEKQNRDPEEVADELASIKRKGTGCGKRERLPAALQGLPPASAALSWR